MSTQLTTAPDDFQLELLKQATACLPTLEPNGALKARLRVAINGALRNVDDPVLLQMLRALFDEISRVFDRLFLIERKLTELDTLLESLSILEVMHFEIRHLIDFIADRALSTSGLPERLSETLDGIHYGMTHDVKRVFERELKTDIRTKLIPVVYGKIRHAHGLLSNCFQQSLITLIQVLNPKLNPIDLFDDFEVRLRQSLLLCNDLSALLRVVKQAETLRTSDALQTVVDKALEFRDGSMQYLMYRDWRGYEHHSLALITSIQGDFDSNDLLHQFGCYLEVLYGHVKMRAVLTDLFPSTDGTEADD
jgi:hypothetical protein